MIYSKIFWKNKNSCEHKNSTCKSNGSNLKNHRKKTKGHQLHILQLTKLVQKFLEHGPLTLAKNRKSKKVKKRKRTLIIKF